MLRNGHVVKRFVFEIWETVFVRFHPKICPLLASMPNLIQLSLTFRVVPWPDFDPAQELHLLAHLPSLRYASKLLFGVSR